MAQTKSETNRGRASATLTAGPTISAVAANSPLVPQRISIKTPDWDYIAYSVGDGPLCLLWHGFPDQPTSFFGLMRRLAAVGLRVVAPYLRGYGPDDPRLAAKHELLLNAHDGPAILNSLGVDRAHLIGHDWGAIIGYLTVNAHPQRFVTLTTMAVPPFRLMSKNATLRQLWQSRYIGLFQLPNVAERVIRARDFAYLDTLWRRWSPKLGTHESQIEMKAVLRAPGALENALAYYRGIFAPSSERQRLAFLSVSTPTLLLAGREDGCVGPRCYREPQRAFDEPPELIYFDCGHFMHLERPRAVADAISSFLLRQAAS